ncbi:PucR family transcriptional regulator [Nocardioides sp. CPCC 205120]|uniref:PucR family transcriptional regulator n=1 Tax=Nocardioides sp. CPCC 205120 TaxID=3406462 RepID=UPI003B50C816
MGSVTLPIKGDDAAALARLATAARAVAADLAAEIADEIQDKVASYAGPPDGRRHRLIEDAVVAAIEHLLAVTEGRPFPNARVDDMFRQMGQGEALEEGDLDATQAAFRIATQDAWRHLRSLARTHGLSAHALGVLGDRMFAYLDHLVEQTRIGYDVARRRLEADRGRARRRLFDALLRGTEGEGLRTLSTAAQWRVPERVVVAGLQHGDREAGEEAATHLRQEVRGLLAGSRLLDRVLVRPDASGLLLLVPAAEVDEVLEVLDPVVTGAGNRLGVGWAVGPGELRDALRWVRTTLALAAAGVVPDGPLLRCAEHRTQLWLHAEPLLRQGMVQDLLSPLLAETPNSREILSETLLAWLESRDSAPAIAARLGVHAQTVRYRWKRINELFGEALHDPEFVVALTLVLKASVPLWKAGDQRDFERFHRMTG